MWGHYFIDHERENTLDNDRTDERISYGVDAAVGWGGFSMTAAYSMGSVEDSFDSADFYSYLDPGRLSVPRYGVGDRGPLQRLLVRFG